MVEGAPKTKVQTDSSGHFVTPVVTHWYLLSEDTPDGDMGIPFSNVDGYLLVTRPAYRQARVEEYGGEESATSVFAFGTNFKVEALGDILLRRQH